MKKDSGFTIIEVSLVLAVSGLLVLVAMLGTGGMIRATRFTDSTRSIHAYVQKQYDQILNGVNSRDNQVACSNGDVTTGTSSDPGTTNCLLLGKLISLPDDSNVVTTYNIVGTEPAIPNYNQSDAQLISDFSPKLVTATGVDNFQIPWGAIVSSSKRTAGNIAVDAIAIIRSPRSANVLTYTFRQPGGSYNLFDYVNPALAGNAGNFSSRDNTTNFCFQNADFAGGLSMLTVTGGQGQESFGISFNATAGDCNGS